MGFYDKCIKKICVACPRLMVLATNSIFHKNYDENAEVVFLDKEQITDAEEEASYMDMLFSIEENEYHWEFQLLEDHMAIRMYEYGVKETLRQVQTTADSVGKDTSQYELYVRMPQQAVIFLAGCKMDYIKVILTLPDEQEVSYQLPCIDASDPVQVLIERDLYLLLPFQQVQMNDRMNHIKNAKEETKKNLAVELHEYYRKVRKALEKLRADGILTAREVEMLQDMLSDIEMYLSEKDNTIHKEVKSMGDNDYISFSERAENRGRQEGRQEGRYEGELRGKINLICKKLKKGMSEEEIAEILEEDIAMVQDICQVAREYAPDYDVDIIYEAYVKEK